MFDQTIEHQKGFIDLERKRIMPQPKADSDVLGLQLLSFSRYSLHATLRRRKKIIQSSRCPYAPDVDRREFYYCHELEAPLADF